MKISNSALRAWWFCPKKFEEIYINGLQQPESEAMKFGGRFHERLQAWYTGLSPVGVGYVSGATALEPQLEADVLAMFEAYKAAYPLEPFEIVECEKSFELPIPGSKHTYVGRIDMLVRDKATKKLQIMETKTEKSGSKRNSPKAWTARTQASLYVWAAQQIFKQPIDTVILNVATKPSPKGQVGPNFRRDNLHRSPKQIAEALKDLQYVASQLDSLTEQYDYGDETKCGGKTPTVSVWKEFPANRNNCTSDYGWNCEFWDLHNIGRSEELIQQQFVQISPYSYLEM